MQYELFYLVGERQEANLDEIRGKVEEILKSEKASLLDPEVVEKRKLAYEIRHQRKGVYVTRRFELPEKVGEESKKESSIERITKQMNLAGEVLRFLIVKTDDLPDLGAKERRKAKDLSSQKQSFKRPEKPQQVAKKETLKKADAEEAASAAESVKKPSIEKGVAEKEKKETEKAEDSKESKEEARDIDKQLDKLLDI